MEIIGKTGKKILGLLVGFSACGVAAAQQPVLSVPPVDGFSGHPRVAIISDIGNEPDDQMSFVRLLLYSNELDLEAMIATTSTWQKTATHAETMHALIQAYGQVRDNLLLHAKGWPTAEELDRRVFAGQPAYGMAATGAGKSSAGSRASREPSSAKMRARFGFASGEGLTRLAQALMDLRAAHSAAGDGEAYRAAARLTRSPTRTTPARGFGASFPILLLYRHAELPRTGKSTTTPLGRASAETSTTATARGRYEPRDE